MRTLKLRETVTQSTDTRKYRSSNVTLNKQHMKLTLLETMTVTVFKISSSKVIHRDAAKYFEILKYYFNLFCFYYL